MCRSIPVSCTPAATTVTWRWGWLARILPGGRPTWPARSNFFQPAEEGLGGALAVMADGALEKSAAGRGPGDAPLVAGPSRPARVVEGRRWPPPASSPSLSRVRAATGPHHHLATDPIIAAAHVVVALQSIVSRNTDPP